MTKNSVDNIVGCQLDARVKLQWNISSFQKASYRIDTCTCSIDLMGNTALAKLPPEVQVGLFVCDFVGNAFSQSMFKRPSELQIELYAWQYFEHWQKL